MHPVIDIQNTIDSTALPSLENIQSWCSVALEKAQAEFEEPELTIRIVSPQESQSLNLEYRDKDKSTNVLSFPFEAPGFSWIILRNACAR